MSGLVPGSDGLPARDSGEWGQVKLEFLDVYAPVALDATATKHQRVFVDLFAGPGLNRGRYTGVEFTGSPLRAMQVTGRRVPQSTFTHLVTVNYLRPHFDALQQRIARRIALQQSKIPPQRIRQYLGDSRSLLPEILRGIPTRGYVLVFADIEGIREWPWQNVRELQAQGHRSVDLCLLFPLDMTIKRLVSIWEHQRERYAESLTAFFGTSRWRAATDGWITDRRSANVGPALERVYVEQLQTQFTHVRAIRNVRMRGGRSLYRLLFASNHEAGDRIAQWADGVQEGTQQLPLL